MYSDTSGSSWTFANGFTGSYTDSSGSFNYIAYDVAYNGGVWLASGISWYTVEEEPISNVYKKELRASSNGVDWVRLDNVGATIPDIVDPQFPTYPYSEIGPIFYASNEWNVLIHQKSGDGNSWIPYIFTNSSTDVSGLTGIWQKTQTDLPMINSISGVNISNIPNYRGFLPSLYVRTGTPTQSTITFQNTTGGGPVFTSPTQVSYTVYQYMPIVPITFSATGTGTVYLFVNSGSLPTGLTWDPYTETIQGKTVNVGTYSFVVYAKDDVGITSLTITITTVIPRVIRQQTSAGAYTYLVKQYTEVNAAQEARDNRVTPAQDSGLGKFMAPTAPSVTTDSNCRC
jgi:hypothetical protein